MTTGMPTDEMGHKDEALELKSIEYVDSKGEVRELEAVKFALIGNAHNSFFIALESDDPQALASHFEGKGWVTSLEKAQELNGRGVTDEFDDERNTVSKAADSAGVVDAWRLSPKYVLEQKAINQSEK